MGKIYKKSDRYYKWNAEKLAHGANTGLTQSTISRLENKGLFLPANHKPLRFIIDDLITKHGIEMSAPADGTPAKPSFTP